LLNPAEAKEKILKALSARRVVERGWLTALLGLYLAKRKEAKVRLKHIGDVVLQRKDFGALRGLRIILLSAGHGCLRSSLGPLATSLGRRTPFPGYWQAFHWPVKHVRREG